LTAYHPETNEQTEYTNAIMKQYLQVYIFYMQDDWLDWLPMAEFVYNNTMSETTRVSPFLADSGQHPRMGFEPPTNMPRPHYQTLQAREANKFVKNMSDLEEYLKSEMKWAQAVYESNTNRNRDPAPAYQVGDYVYIDTRNMKTRRPSKKLDLKNLGPVPVIKVVSPYTYKVQLPKTMKNYNVFHTSLLRPAPNPDLALPGQRNNPPPPVEVEGEQEYIIDRIEDSHYDRRTKRHEYLVKWTGYDESTWEPYEFVRQATALTDFYNRYPNRSRPDNYDKET
jgi:Chromo (CHRromatin Organisation MOdifier) domain